jgi:inner membrane protein
VANPSRILPLFWAKIICALHFWNLILKILRILQFFMDSLTQIVLGAACGEAVAGRKLGNRAMLWGAVGGTIPDLDVFAAFFTDEIAATSFHRGFMHSFLFAALAPWGLAKLTEWFYKSNVHRRRDYKVIAMGVWLLFYLTAAIGINFIPVLLGEGLSWYVMLPTLGLGGWFAWKLWQDYWNKEFKDVAVPYMTWVSLFFWSIFTHPILDCFTSWGTQIWQPFSDERVQWNTISVVDPIYTVPFALFLIVASRLARSSKLRFALTWLGIIWSCGYLAYTYWHKQTVETLFKEKLQKNEVQVQRFTTNPSIFNNIVWYGVAESDTAYHFGLYGFNDSQGRFGGLSLIPKNHQLLNGIPQDDRAIRFLRWFTDGYYNVLPYNKDTLQVNDLRFGLLGDTLTGRNYVFPFLLFKNERGVWDLKQDNRNQKNIAESKASFGKLWERVKGDR